MARGPFCPITQYHRVPVSVFVHLGSHVARASPLCLYMFHTRGRGGARLGEGLALFSTALSGGRHAAEG